MDFILKCWPKEDVATNKIDSIIKGLKAVDFIGNETVHWNKKAFFAGKSFFEYVQLENDNKDQGYLNNLRITIFEDDYGLKPNEEMMELEGFDRKNVVSIYEGDGSIKVWDQLLDKLFEITGDEYEGGWEFL